MYFERLLLEIHANTAGWKVVRPPLRTGESGTQHRFSFLATDGTYFYGFDLCPEASERDVLDAATKMAETKTLTVIVNLSGRPKGDMAKLADDHGITILGPGDVGPFFSLDRTGEEHSQHLVPRTNE